MNCLLVLLSGNPLSGLVTYVGKRGSGPVGLGWDSFSMGSGGPGGLGRRRGWSGWRLFVFTFVAPGRRGG